MTLFRIICFFSYFLLISCQQKTTESPPLDFNLEKAENLRSNKAYDKAYYYYNQSLAYNQEKNNYKRMIYCLLKMAEIERIACDYNASENTTTKAISYFDKETPTSYRVNAYMGLGLNYTHLNNFTEGLKIYKKALQLSDNELTSCIIQNNIAYLYSKQGKYKNAIEVLNTIENNTILKDNPLEYARVLHNKGYFLFHLKAPNALIYMEKALAIRETNKDDSQIVSSYMHLANYHIDSNKTTAAKWAQKAYESATKATIPDDQLEALNILFRTSENSDLKTQYHNQYFKLNDSLVKARQQTKNQFAKIKYDSEKAETEKTAYQYKMYGFIVLLILSVAVFILLYRLKKKKNKSKILETQYTTETKIAKRLHDELANDVHNTIAFAETQNLENEQNKETLLKNLDTIYQRARNISNENKEINTGKNYFEQLKHMINSYASDNINVIFNGSALHEVKLDSEIKIALYRVLQELMVNMKKHSECSLVMISFKETNSALEINYSDNGKGTDNQLQIKNGLQNVENRIFSINGNITFDTEPNKGFKVKITIPK